MRKVIQKEGRIVVAYRLGEENPVLQNLIEIGLIKEKEDGSYEIFSLEAVNGRGEIAYAGDYVKLSSTGEPYPNSAEDFKTHHRHIEGDKYEQIPEEREAWMAQDAMCEEIQFLIDHKGLVLCEEDDEKYFNAFLWGAPLSAAKNAVLVFYGIERDTEGKITDATFNFVARNEFDMSYNEIVDDKKRQSYNNVYHL